VVYFISIPFLTGYGGNLSDLISTVLYCYELKEEKNLFLYGET